MTELIKTMHDKIKTRLRSSPQRPRGLSDLPAEIKDQIIRYAIPPFIPRISISHKHKCRPDANKELSRWKVTGIPQVALNLQLVNREIGAIAKKRMIKECCGLNTDWPINCGCFPLPKCYLKHTEVVYRLKDVFTGSAIQTPPHLLWFSRLMDIGVSTDDWTRLLHVRDDLYLSPYSRDWSIMAAVDSVIPMVIERFISAKDMAGGMIMQGQGESLALFRARIALLAELNIRFMPSATVSFLKQMATPQEDSTNISIETDDQNGFEKSSTCPCPLPQQGAIDHGKVTCR